MAIFGLGEASKKDDSSKSKRKDAKKDNASNLSQEEEAKLMLEKMEAKKNADECPFC